MTHEELKAKVQALADAASSNETVKAFANEWLAAEGTDKQAGLTKELPTVVKENIALIDETINFMGSSTAAELFGKEAAHAMLKHAEEIKAHGGYFCVCRVCFACNYFIDLLD